jgi:hypothetical protein
MDYFQLPWGVKLVNPLPVDARRYNTSNLPYADTAQVLAQNVEAIRHLGMVFYVLDGSGGVVEYWFKDGVTDGDLILKGTGGESGGIISVIQVTFAELKALKDASNLTTGSYYLISDYKTVYKQPVTGIISDSAQGITDGLDTPIEPIIIQAVTEEQFQPYGFSTVYSSDIVYYDYDLDLSDGGSVNAKGAIYRRQDVSRAIDIGFDWRTIKFRRYEATTTDWSDVTVYAKNETAKVGTMVYISMEDANVGNDPVTTVNDKWVKFYDTSGSVSDRELWATQSSGTIFGLTIGATFKDVYFFTDLADLNTSSGAIADINNFLLITPKGLLDINITILIDSALFGTLDLKDNYIYIPGGSVTFRPDTIMRNVNMSLINNPTDLYVGGAIAWMEFSGQTFTESYINGGNYCTITQAVNSILMGSNGVAYAASFVESTSLAMNDCVLGLSGVIGRNVNTITMDTCDLMDSRITGDSTMSFTTHVQKGAAVDLVGASIWDTSQVSANITNCNLPNMKGVDIQGILINTSSIGRWANVVIPSNVTFTDVTLNIAAWLGFNTWSGGLLDLSEKKIEKRYYDGNVTERFWYESVTAQGNVTLIELQ